MNAQAAQPLPDEASPDPPRFRWLKRITIAATIYLILQVAVHFWWRQHAATALQTEIDRILAAGEPLYPEDFNPDPVPDEENAAPLYEQAIAAINLTARQTNFISTDGVLEQILSGKADVAQGIIEDNQTVYELLTKAQQLSASDPGVRYRSPVAMTNAMNPNYGSYGGLSKMLNFRCMHAHASGDDAAAIGAVIDMLMLARHVESEPTLIAHLVASAIEGLAITAIEKISFELQIEMDPTARTASNGKATRAHLQHLIRMLNKEDHSQSGAQTAFLFERMYLLDMAKALNNGQVSIGWIFAAAGGPAIKPGPIDSLLTSVGKPMFQMDSVRMLRFMRCYVDATQQPDWPSAQAKLQPAYDRLAEYEETEGVARLSRMLSELLFPSLGRAVEMRFSYTANQRMAAAALAIRLYELDHGHRPERLDQLVDRYLSAVPLDPMARDAPIRYLPDADPPRLYSVGSDGVDDGGTAEIHPSGRKDPWKPDIMFFLDGPPGMQQPE